MNLILFIIIILISFIVVRIGAIAFQLTGLEHSLAEFQALSCFSGTGFTTRESELIVSHPQRRKIASTLIVIGNAGLVTMIATFANSLRPGTAGTRISLPFLKDLIPAERLPWVNLAVIVLLLLFIYKLFTHHGFTMHLTNLIRKFVLKKDIIKQVSFEELLITTGGYGVSRITICSDSPILEKTLIDSKLRSFDITVLAIIRGHETIPNPPAEISFMLNDELLCFGRLENIQQKICSAS
ncbi:MAG: TrkA C-terminal domain-containing protein [Sedimentisphaerales bacterium]